MMDDSASNDVSHMTMGRKRSSGRSLFLALMVTTAMVAVPTIENQAFAQAASGAAAKTSFNIGPQPLAQALVQFSNSTGVQLFFNADLAREINSQGAQGALTRTDALDRILAGSGLSYKFTNTNTVAIQKPASSSDTAATGPGVIALDTIDVQGANPNSTMTSMPAYAGGQVATGQQLGLLGNRTVTDAPFNVTSYTNNLIQDQQARTITDVLANNPSARVFYADYFGSNDFLVRGNTVTFLDIGYDGLYGIGVPGIESIDRVEVLVGANALLNGLGPGGGAGGMINQAPKKPLDTPLTEISTGYYGGQYGAAADISRRFGSNDQFGMRFNGAYREGGTGVDNQSRKVGSATMALDWQSEDERARISTNFGYRSDENQAPSRTTWITTLPSGYQLPSAPKNPGSNWQNPWSYDDAYTTFGTARAEYDITPDITAYAAIGASRYREEEFFTNTGFLNDKGDILQQNVYWPIYRDTVTAETGLRGTLQTGPVNHRWSLAISGLQNESGVASTLFSTTYSNIYDPVFIAQPSRAGLPDSDHIPKTASVSLYGVALADTLSVLDDKAQLTLGIRNQGVHSKNFSSTTGAVTSEYDKTAWTPAYGLVVKPWDGLALYANYIEGLQQGGLVPSGYSNAGQSLAPFISKQYEIGAKYDFGNFLVSLSAYQIETPNAIANGTTYGINGEQTTKGIELNGSGEIMTGVRLLGGVAFTDSRQTKTANGTNNGKKVPGTSDTQVNIGAEWDPSFLPGWTVSGRAIYTSSAYINAANTVSVPGWTRFDAGIRYATKIAGHDAAFRFNVENIANDGYWIAGNNYVTIGRPRTYLLSATVKF